MRRTGSTLNPFFLNPKRGGQAHLLRSRVEEQFAHGAELGSLHLQRTPIPNPSAWRLPVQFLLHHQLSETGFWSCIQINFRLVKRPQLLPPGWRQKVFRQCLIAKKGGCLTESVCLPGPSASQKHCEYLGKEAYGLWLVICGIATNRQSKCSSWNIW